MPFTYQGSTIVQPGVIMAQQSAGMAPPVTTDRLVVVLGISQGGGQPKTLQYVSGKGDAINKLRGGDLQTSVVRTYRDATNPFVAYMRVNPALQASANLQSAGAVTVITLKSSDYGAFANRIAYQTQAGTTQGLKASVTLDGASYAQDNLYQAALSIQYTGAQVSGLVNVSNAAGTVTGSAGATGAEVVAWTADFATFTTIQQLVNFINGQAGWTASVLSASPNSPTSNALDDATSQACKASAFTVTATLQAVVNWLNTVPLVIATRPTGVGSLPVNMATSAYLTTGTDGTTTNSDWSAAFTALQNIQGARIVIPATGESSIHAMVSSHCNYMSDPTIRGNRVSICGGVKGETVTQAVTRAVNLNTRRVSLVYPGIQDTDDITQSLATYAPYIVAAQLAGQLSTLKVTNALTRKKVTSKGLEGTLQSTLQKSDYDTLASSGVMAIKYFQNTNGSSWQVVRSLTTWQQDQAIDNLELSMVCNEDYVDIRVGDAIDALTGQDGGPIGAGQVESEIDSTLRELYKEGVIVGDTNMPAYGNIVASLTGQQVTSTYDATIPAPMNYFGVTTTFRAYSNIAA